MSTTAIYVELLIIGMESTAGIYWIATWFGFDIAKYKDFATSAVGAVFLLGFVYVVGLMFDRIADLMFTSREAKVKQKEIDKIPAEQENRAELIKQLSKTSLLVDTNERQQKYIEFTRSRLRIMRSTVLNSAFLGICVVIHAVMQGRFLAAVPPLVACAAAFAASFYGYKFFVHDFYRKLLQFGSQKK